MHSGEVKQDKTRYLPISLTPNSELEVFSMYYNGFDKIKNRTDIVGTEEMLSKRVLFTVL